MKPKEKQKYTLKDIKVNDHLYYCKKYFAYIMSTEYMYMRLKRKKKTCTHTHTMCGASATAPSQFSNQFDTISIP